MRLSRNFYTTQYTEVMNNTEVKIKSTFALLLGFIPFIFTKLWLCIFRYTASKNSKYIGTLIAFLMMFSIKLFSWSQWLIWGKYVPRPSGDKINTRLAQYGWENQPWIDIGTIIKAFHYPNKLTSGEWNLEEWKNIII